MGEFKKLGMKKVNKKPFKRKADAKSVAHSWRQGGFYARIKRRKKGWVIYRSTKKRKRKVKK